MIRAAGAGVCALVVVACASNDAPLANDARTDDPSATSPLDAGVDDPRPSTGEPPADGGNDGADAGPKGPIGPPPSALPVSYTRPDVGAPVSQAELDAATDDLIALLEDTRYFDFVDERIHGWPQTAPGYWYGTWWSGVGIEKSGGQVTYRHVKVGADNNGLRTPPYLEGACYAHLMWGKPLTEQLVRRIARGYSSWALAMKRNAADTAPTMLTRALYPESVTSTENGRSFFIDYSLNRPGEDNPATEYVHLPNNPTFGDIYIKNKRSKDDMGHILRSIVQMQACAPRLDAAGKADLAEATSLYQAWAKQVAAEGYSIATLDKNANVYTPPVSETLAHYVTLDNVECPGALTMNLLGNGNPGSLSCGSGISTSEKLSVLANKLRHNVRQILRTHHESAANAALFTAQNSVALSLLDGLTQRIETDQPAAAQASPPGDMDPKDIVSLLLHAANTGVPLTSKEVRWIHSRLHSAWASYRAPGAAATYRVFDPATPDGAYPYEPSGEGMWFSDFGVLIGSCASPYRNPTGRPVLDCKKLLAALQN